MRGGFVVTRRYVALDEALHRVVRGLDGVWPGWAAVAAVSRAPQDGGADEMNYVPAANQDDGDNQNGENRCGHWLAPNCVLCWRAPSIRDTAFP